MSEAPKRYRTINMVVKAMQFRRSNFESLKEFCGGYLFDELYIDGLDYGNGKAWCYLNRNGIKYKVNEFDYIVQMDSDEFIAYDPGRFTDLFVNERSQDTVWIDTDHRGHKIFHNEADWVTIDLTNLYGVGKEPKDIDAFKKDFPLFSQFFWSRETAK